MLHMWPIPDLLVLVVMAGVAGLDVVSFPQAMISRPIVSATLGGTFVGQPLAGLTCGVALECLALEALPVGASRYPEWGSASVAAGALAAGHVIPSGLPEAGPFAVAILVAIFASWLGGFTMVKHRQFVGRYARAKLPDLAAGKRDTVMKLQLIGMTMDLLRGAFVGLATLLVATPLVELVDQHWTLREDLSRAVVVTLVAAVAAAAAWKDFHAFTGTRRLFLVSLAVGTGVVLLGA